MTYDTNLMPRNLDEWNQLIDAKLAEEQAKAAADEMYQPQSRAQLEQLFSFYYPQEQPDLPVFAEPVLTPEQVLAQKRSAIDSETSGKILAGFDYEINGETLHFSYDAFDQQNFADTANACLMLKSGATGLPETVNWNAYRHNGELVRLTLTADEFLALYAGGALNHKAVCMEMGGRKKAELA